MAKEKIISTTTSTDIIENDPLEDLKIQKLSPEEIEQKYKEGGYSSYGKFYSEFKEQIDLKKHQLRTLLIDKGLYVPKTRTTKETLPDVEYSGSKELYRLFFNNGLGREIQSGKLPKGRKKWILSEEELELAGQMTDPVLTNLPQMSQKVQMWFNFSFMIATVILPRFIAQIRENKESKIAGSSQKPKSD